jgi:hypothetical protein
MIVRRFAQWLIGFVSPRAHARHAQPVPSAVGVTSEPAPLAATSWLAAARRLRPPRAVPMTQIGSARERVTPARRASSEDGREQVAAGRARPQEPAPGAPPPARGEAAAHSQPAQPAPQSQPLRAEPTLPELERTSEEYALRRRLVSFKQLVRMGVYNEGFRRDAVPEQYARSLDLEDEGQAGEDLP